MPTVGDMVGPDFLCSGSQYGSNEPAVYHALQTGQSVAGLNLIEPLFNTSVGFLDPVTLLTSLAAGPVSDLITTIVGTLAKDGIEPGGVTAVAGLLGKQELTTDASLQQELAAGGDLPPAGGYPPIAGGAQMLGEGGTQTASKTLLRDTGQGFRIDVENPAPGVRPGQLHLRLRRQILVRTLRPTRWEGMPSGLARRIAKDPDAAKAIAKARIYLNVPKP